MPAASAWKALMPAACSSIMPTRFNDSAPVIVAAFAAAAAALIALLRYEPRRAEPLIDLRFFRSTPFAAAVGLAIAGFAMFGGFLFLNTLYLQEVRGLSPVQAGLATVPLALMTALMSPVSGRLVAVRGPRLPLVLAGACTVTACLMLTGLREDTSLPWLLVAYAIFGVGFGFLNTPITNTAVSGMPRAQAGVASAVATTSRQVGQTLGVAIVGAVVASSAAWWTLAAFGAIVLVLGVLGTTARAHASAERTAAELNPEALAA
jgi:predicted MFS family arabinose efflux permease